MGPYSGVSDEKKMIRKTGDGCRVTILAVVIFLAASSILYAEEQSGEYSPARSGIAFTAGRSYDPTGDIDFYMVSGFILYDYDRIWRHSAPENLRFKIEGSAGFAHDKKKSLAASANMFALYYLNVLKTGRITPYIEGGIGVIYTNFQVKGQGLRLNFNPQIGLGAEIRTGSEDTLFFTLRGHHISNGGLNDDNRGINSVMCMFGYFF